ncbi:MAG: ATP-dependent DNA ligase [Planctomycetota bacterium]
MSDLAAAVRLIGADDVAERARDQGPVRGFWELLAQPLGEPRSREAELARMRSAQDALGLPDHLACALWQRWREDPHEVPPEGFLDSLPFHDVCYGLLLPLAGLAPARSLRLFGLRGPGRLDGAGRRALVSGFLAQPDTGLSLVDKVCLVRGDPFAGGRLGTSLNVLLDALATVSMTSPGALRNTLGRVGDLRELFVSHAELHRSDPPLTTREVLVALRGLKGLPTRLKRDALASLLGRAGRLERFFLVGFLRQGSRVGQTLGDDALIDALAEVTGAERARLDVARSLVDMFELAHLLEEEGHAGLAALALKPLAPVGPMLAGPEVPSDQRFPVLFETKYDGIRLMVHKATNEHGGVRCAAFTRRRLDWTQQIPGLQALAWALPCRDAIVDGELHAHVFTELGPRPASVYDLLKTLRGEGPPLRYRFAAFDLLYLDGRDLTGEPLVKRRAALSALLAPIAALPLPLPVALSDGDLVQDAASMRRLYELFRSQGHEGGIAKDPHSPYELGRRSDRWTKLKPALTLDLAVVGALYTTSADGPGASFGTYLIAALGDGPALVEVGRVQGLGARDSAQLMQAILDEGLLSGRTLERQTSTGLKAGVELRPGIVATVRFEGVVRDEGGLLSLRDPKIVRIRTGEKDLSEIDRVRTLDDLHLKQRLG